MPTVEERIDALLERLRAAEGHENWEQFWLRLVREYEELCERNSRKVEA